MARRKKLDNQPGITENESLLSKLRRFNAQKKEAKETVDLLEALFYKPYIEPFINKIKSQRREQTESEKAKQIEAIKKMNTDIASRVDALRSFHKFHSTFSVKEYMEQEKKRIQEFGTDIVYKSIVEGGEWFQRYCAYNVYENRKKAFDNCGLFYRVSYSLHSVSDKHKNVVVSFPPFKDFNVLKQLNHDNEMTQITKEFLEWFRKVPSAGLKSGGSH